MGEDICPECIAKLRAMNNAKNAGDKKEVEALQAEGVPEDVGDEVRALINKMIRMRNAVAKRGGSSDAATIDQYIESARGHYLSQEYDPALDSVQEGFPIASTAYAQYVYAVQATTKIHEIEESLKVAKAAPAMPAMGGEATAKAEPEETEEKLVMSTLQEARQLMAEKKFKEASNVLDSLKTPQTEKKKAA